MRDGEVLSGKDGGYLALCNECCALRSSSAMTSKHLFCALLPLISVGLKTNTGNDDALE